ncbi:DUF3108 domain-containing protein [Iodobacter sp. LRB]|uniref:DUF3108 domain-containing protein n=1 Tax=unclassified Iodobacter TaxID=235634 RepID=UPI000C1072EE|nr:DUF3108 domain-containing protein [Iodobacter sp. BJB302]PHV02655.1 hypothetical protein CSQ88_05390 [Iodobacter sp. BJB302]
MLRWPGLLLGIAALLSLLLHLGSIFNEQIYAWLTQQPYTESELKKVTQKLSDIAQADDARPAGLKGVKPADHQVVYLHHGPVLHKKTAEKPVVLAAKKSPVRMVASSPAAAERIASSVAVAASEVVKEVPQASAASSVKPVVVIASAVVEEELPPLKESPLVAEQTYPAAVEITYAYGIFPIRMSWKAENGHYSLKLRGALFSKSRTFISDGEVGQKGVIPHRFADYRDEKLINEALFNWDDMQVTIKDGGSSKVEALKAGDQDIFSAAFQLALQGSRMKDFTFTVASGRKIYKDVPFEISGQASLRLGDRQIEAILLRGRFEDRTFDFWLAPQWHNMPVRMTLSLGSEGSFDIWANDIKINGEMVLEPPSNSHNSNSNRMMRR